MWKAEDAVSGRLADLAILFESKRSLEEENERLRAIQQAALLSREQVDILRAENESLKALLGRDDPTERILAAVLVRPPVSPFDTLIIDAGRNHGVSIGMPITASGVVIGLVTEVFANAARVKLFSAPEEETDVLIGADAIAARAIGQGGGNFRITVPKGVSVAKGDMVLMPGLSLQPIGTIAKVESGAADPVLNITFKSPINFFELRFVEVIKDSNEFIL